MCLKAAIGVTVVADAMARQAPAGLLGIHVNMPATVPPDVAKALSNGDPAPPGLSDKEKAAFDSLNNLYKKGGGYAAMVVTRPQTVGYALADSPAGQAAWMYDVRRLDVQRRRAREGAH